MAIEEQIVAWAQKRPRWQREIISRIAKGEVFLPKECNKIVDGIVNQATKPEFNIGFKHFPSVPDQAQPTRIISIAETKHVNALASPKPLEFEPHGITVIYGDNGSGKSGYARLLKRITHARDRVDVLSDVFEDTIGDMPVAKLRVSIGGQDKQIRWPEGEFPELQHVHFYDKKCMDFYVSNETDFPYRPAQLNVINGLIETCVTVQQCIEKRLHHSVQPEVHLPLASEKLRDTTVGNFLDKFSYMTSIDSLDNLLTRLNDFPETTEELESEERRLRNADSGQERLFLTREAEKFDALHEHINSIHSVIGDESLSHLQAKHIRLQEAQHASSLLASAFASEPLDGVGTSPWRTLWESARKFSEQHAYPEKPFPYVDDQSRCVLCHQILESDSRKRLHKFEEFVKDETQTRLDKAHDAYEEHVSVFRSINILPISVEKNLRDLEPSNSDAIESYKKLLEQYRDSKSSVLEALNGVGSIVLTGIQPTSVLDQLASGAEKARKLAADLGNQEIVQKQLEEVIIKRSELETLRELHGKQNLIAKEIQRLKMRRALEEAKVEADTGPITRKVSEFTETAISQAVRNQFNREVEHLRLGRVLIQRTRASRGIHLFQPELDQARQKVKLDKVLSEGEQSALGLAGFFTEAELDHSKSALILDDPVTSLDHNCRSLVAARLATLATDRQVIVFTHDIAFVADLKRAAVFNEVNVAPRSVVRSRSQKRNPGMCLSKFPWKVQDVSERIHELKTDLAQIKRQEAGMSSREYERQVGGWAGDLSETWERIFNQEIVGPILAEGSLEVRPRMVKVLADFSERDRSEFDSSYSKVSMWARRHDKSPLVNHVPPDVTELDKELQMVENWFARIKKYKN